MHGRYGGHADTPDEALTRLEDALLAYPFDRALPDLATILADAGVTEELLRSDDRATKLLHEAIVARPLSSLDTVGRLRTEVELLTLEVQVMTERLSDPQAAPDELHRASARMTAIRARLEELREEL